LKDKGKHITVFEHQAIKLNQVINDVTFDSNDLKALQKYYGEEGVPFFGLTHNGVRFNEYVGVIQVANTTFEVLPKADKHEIDAKYWRNILIGMLKAVSGFEIKSTSESSLKIKPNSILDLYFELFIDEVEYLIHSGLIKQYRKKESNVNALKGSLLFGKHIQQNLTHQEKFFVRHNTYDYEHKLHFILYKTIRLLNQINTNENLNSRIGALLLYFPQMPDMKVLESTFEKIIYTRKNQSYKKAIEISKMILLNYHPDVSKGKNNVLALMFDMNMLWEQFVFASLKKNNAHKMSLSAQSKKLFWKKVDGQNSKIIPDIVINKDSEKCVVLDTKWKNLNGFNPSPDDLRQMYVYHEYYSANKVALIYPSNTNSIIKGNYYNTNKNELDNKECSIINISVPKHGDNENISIKEWQNKIAKVLFDSL